MAQSLDRQGARAILVFPKKWMFGPLLPPAQGAAGVVTQLWKCRKPRDCRLCPAPVECPRHARRLSAGPIATSLTPSAPPPPSLSLSLTPPPSPPAHREGRGKRGAVRCVDGLWWDSDGGPLPRRALPPRSRLRAHPGCANSVVHYPKHQILGKHQCCRVCLMTVPSVPSGVQLRGRCWLAQDDW